MKVANKIELAQFDAVAFDPAIIAHPVGHGVGEPGKTHDCIIVSAGKSEILGSAVVPMDTLLDLWHAPGIRGIERPDLLASLPTVAEGADVVTICRPSRDVTADEVNHRQRPFGYRR